MASEVNRYAPTLLTGTTDRYIWENKIRKLPLNVSQMSRQSQERFMQMLRNLPNSSFRVLSPEEREASFQKKWTKIQKTLPNNHYTEKIFILIKVAGVAFLIIIGVFKVRAQI